MNDPEIGTSQELEQMRQAALKQQFDKQQIISGALMEKAFQADARWLSFDQGMSYAIGALAIPATIVICLLREVPLGFMAAFVVFISLGLGGNLLLHRNLSKDTLYEEDILTAVRKVRRFKQQTKWLEIVTWIVALILFGSFVLTVHSVWPTPETGLLFLPLIAVGIVIDVFYTRRLLQACDDMLDRLTLKEEENTNG